MAADKTSFWRSPAFRVSLWAGLSAGPVLALLWPVFVRLESGVWPASPLALTVAMLTLGTLTGVAAALTLMLPVLSFMRLPPGPSLRRTAAAVGAALCFALVAAFGVITGVERLGAQWPLWLVLTIAGAVCGWIGGLAVPAAPPQPSDQATDRAP